MEDKFNIKNYELYLTYDDPIPFISEASSKYRSEIEEEINKIQFKENITEQDEFILNVLREEFEKQILYIYPARVKDYIKFYTYVESITIDKNKIPDPKIISMGYLDFIFYLIENDTNGLYYLTMLCGLLNLCCGIELENIRYDKSNDNKINLILEIKKDDGNYTNIVLNKKDFDYIKKIILHQNMPDYDDEYIDPKLEKALKEAEEFKNKHKKKIGSLEDQIICVLISTSLDEERIKNLTIRKFVKILQRVDFKLHYEIYKTASMSGFVTFKEDIDHWMSDLSIDKFANKTVDFNQLKNKIQGNAN